MLAVIRIRGSIKTKKKLNDTMEMLRLFRVNHMVLVPEDKQNRKMIEKVKDFVTFGEIEAKTFERVLNKRALIAGNIKISLEFLKEKKINSVQELAEKILSGKTKLSELGIKPVFRLKPPRKGFERQGIKKPFSLGGALGYRATQINELINRMV
ncbi:MAG: 50S ribosomal protein L30 [archaeon]